MDNIDIKQMHEELSGSIIPLFPTPLYTWKTTDKEYQFVQGEIQRVVDKLYAENIWSQKDGWNSTTHNLSNAGDFDRCIITEENMEMTRAFIMHHAVRLLAAMSVDTRYQPKITASWLTLTKPGQYAHCHDHGSNDISGAYWFKTNGQDGDIFFMNGNKALKCSRLTNTIAQEAHFSPDQGRLVLFPSWLDHGVRENKTDEDRISLSINISLDILKDIHGNQE